MDNIYNDTFHEYGVLWCKMIFFKVLEAQISIFFLLWELLMLDKLIKLVCLIVIFAFLASEVLNY